MEPEEFSSAPSTEELVPSEDGAASVEPDELISEFQQRSEKLDRRLDSLQSLINEIRGELRDDAQSSLSKLAEAAHDMADGRIYQKIDVEAKGELAGLVASINQTMQNLQQLDSSVKEQSNKVPELAAQLDAITKDTEEATQGVMNRLDTLMANSDQLEKDLNAANKSAKEHGEAQVAFQQRIDTFLERASAGESPTTLAQEILDFLFEHRLGTRSTLTDLSGLQGKVRSINDEAFEILNTLQFQDITRQKIEKVVMLLKIFQSGLQHLLHIFHIDVEGSSEIFEHRTIATQDKIFETKLEADSSKQSVEDIIAAFQKKQS